MEGRGKGGVELAENEGKEREEGEEGGRKEAGEKDKSMDQQTF